MTDEQNKLPEDMEAEEAARAEAERVRIKSIEEREEQLKVNERLRQYEADLNETQGDPAKRMPSNMVPDFDAVNNWQPNND